MANLALSSPKQKLLNMWITQVPKDPSGEGVGQSSALLTREGRGPVWLVWLREWACLASLARLALSFTHCCSTLSLSVYLKFAYHAKTVASNAEFSAFSCLRLYSLSGPLRPGLTRTRGSAFHSPPSTQSPSPFHQASSRPLILATVCFDVSSPSSAPPPHSRPSGEALQMRRLC